MNSRTQHAHGRTNSIGEAGGCHEQWRGSGDMTQLEALYVY